jgi:hypothetical protein
LPNNGPVCGSRQAAPHDLHDPGSLGSILGGGCLRHAVFLTNAFHGCGAKDPAFVLCPASLASRGGAAPRLGMVGAASRLG